MSQIFFYRKKSFLTKQDTWKKKKKKKKINIDVTSPKDTNKKGLGFTVIQWERNSKITRAVKSFSIHK